MAMKFFKRTLGFYVLLFVSTTGYGQQSEKKSDVLKVKEIKTTLAQDVSFLASDSLNGRALGTVGYDVATDYVIKQFETYGIQPFFKTYNDSFLANDTKTKNIVGVVKGNDSLLSKEYIVLGAHLDHIGTAKVIGGDSIANGANDNATGVSVVLALAKHFATMKSIKRSLIFVLFGAEESGLVGSKHLANKLKELNTPIYTMLNFEMVGVPMAGKKYVAYLTGYSKSNMAEKLNDYGENEWIGFLPKAKEYQLFKRSDNYSFYKELEVPSHTLSTFDFSNYDFYHHVDDEADKMNYDFMSDLVELIIPAVTAMANTTENEILLN